MLKSQVPSVGPSRSAPRKALHWMLQQLGKGFRAAGEVSVMKAVHGQLAPL